MDSDEADLLDFRKRSFKLNGLVTKLDSLFSKVQHDLKKVYAIQKLKDKHNRSNLDDQDSLSTENDSISSAPSYNLKTTLRDYQRLGVEWLCSLHIHGVNGIIADEMGLGKTLQVIAFFQLLFEKFENRGPHIVVAPLSVLSGWETEISKFVGNQIFVYKHYGEKAQRESDLRVFYKYIRECFGGKRSFQWNSVVILTTYQIVIKDVHLLKMLCNGSAKLQYLVVDEAHRLKNRDSILYRALSQLNISRRILLTGTPLQNNIHELWSLLSFILPHFFNEEEEWYDWFNRPFEAEDATIQLQNSEEEEKYVGKVYKKLHSKLQSVVQRDVDSNADEEVNSIVACLHKIIKPFMLRRTRNEVTLNLPTKVEKLIYCPMSKLQTKLHQILRNNMVKSEETTSKGGLTREVLSLMNDHYDLHGSSVTMTFNNLLMKLRKICNHPFLFLDDLYQVPDELYHKSVLETSGKLVVLNDLIDLLLKDGHKILIFSQLTSMLDVIEGFFLNKQLKYVRLDGSTSLEDREKQINMFQRNGISSNSVSNGEGDGDDDIRLFLLSTRAGGVGLNLQTADTVILFDSDWNPHQDLQALSRVYRIGQNRNVLILRLVSSGPDENTYSIDEYMLDNANRKLDAERQILVNGMFSYNTNTINEPVSSKRKTNSKDEIYNLASSATYSEKFFHRKEGTNNQDTISMQFNEESLCQICDRNNVQDDQSFRLSFPPFPDDHVSKWQFWFDILDPPAKSPTVNKELTSHIVSSSVTVVNELSDSEFTLLEGQRYRRKESSSEFESESIDSEDSFFPSKKVTSASSVNRKRKRKVKRQTSEEKSKPNDNILPEEDICVLCDQPWISIQDYSTINLFHGHNFAEDNIEEFLDMMIICDGCEGSYHMICAGLTHIPEDDWFCSLCKATQ